MASNHSDGAHHSHNGTSHNRFDSDKPHLDSLTNEYISSLAPFSSLILTITVVMIFFIKTYILEKLLLNTKRYKVHFERLNPSQQCTFINHHVAAGCKIVLLCSAAYPFLNVAFGHSKLQDPVAGDHRPTNGDLMIVCSQLFTAMYIFELYFRRTVSLISAAHHIGAIVITQSAVAIALNFRQEKDATFEFILCFVWGAFDVVAEFWPHLAIIIYRLYPGQHALSYRIFLSTAIAEVVGTTFETAVVFWLWGSLWSEWTLPFKIVTPLLHALFSAAQLFGAWVFWNLAKKEKQCMEETPSLRRIANEEAQGESKPKGAMGEPKSASEVIQIGV